MSEKKLPAGLIEAAINQALSLDPEAGAKLTGLNGKRISISLDFAPAPWIFAVNDGRLSLADCEPEDCDVRLTGTLGGFLHLFKPEQPPKPEDKLYIEGDLHSAQLFQRSMSQLKPDFDAVLRQRLGGKAGSAAAAVLSQAKSQGEYLKAQAEDRLREFLSSDDGQFIGRQELEQFSGKISALEDALTRLEARLNTLENR